MITVYVQQDGDSTLYAVKDLRDGQSAPLASFARLDDAAIVSRYLNGTQMRATDQEAALRLMAAFKSGR